MLRFGFFLGAAFQIRDDILNLIGSEVAYGKELLGDLREGKQTLMLIHLVAATDPEDRDRVAQFVALPPTERSADMIAEILEMMHSHGSVGSPRSSREASPDPLPWHSKRLSPIARLARSPLRARPRSLHG